METIFNASYLGRTSIMTGAFVTDGTWLHLNILKVAQVCPDEQYADQLKTSIRDCALQVLEAAEAPIWERSEMKTLPQQVEHWERDEDRVWRKTTTFSLSYAADGSASGHLSEDPVRRVPSSSLFVETTKGSIPISVRNLDEAAPVLAAYVDGRTPAVSTFGSFASKATTRR